MTQPTNYTPTTDFSQQESINASGRSTVNTAALDAEFANIETTLDQTVSNLSLIQRDDGRLKDVSVEIHTISPEVLNLIGGGYALRGLWAAATAYAVNDLCSNGAYTYVCRTAHTSGGSFDGQYWIQFGFTSGADAAAAAAAAQSSATSAAGSATAAGNSATAAAASASSISGVVASASSYASIATTKAGEAASSATAANNSAIAAAASAASIDVSTFAPKTGAGTSGSWPISITGNAATASSASMASSAVGGRFTASSSYPKIELHKTGVVAGQWAIDASNNLVYESTGGDGVAVQDLLTLTPSGALSALSGFSGNSTTATRLSNDAGAPPSYSCRAWVNFNGTLPAASMISGSGNVSSITDNGVGNYGVNFSTAMPDDNYAVLIGPGVFGQAALTALANSGSQTAAGFQILTMTSGAIASDQSSVSIGVFR